MSKVVRMLNASREIEEQEIRKDVIDRLTRLSPPTKEEYGKYFAYKLDAVLIPVAQILVSHIQDSGIINANTYMCLAYKGMIEKRDPITVLKHGDDYVILDGNATYVNAVVSDWLEILCIVDG
jgi:hypothetical protein